MILQIGSHNLLVGLDWSIESNNKTASATIKLNKGRRHIKSRLPDKKILVGLVPEGVKISGKVIPGALAVAASVRECVICHEIPGTELIWFCAISDGAPLPGFDQVLHKDQYRARASEIMTYYPNATMIGSIPGVRSSLEDVVTAVGGRRLSKLRIRSPLFWPIVVSNIALVTIAALVATSNFMERQRLLEIERLRLQEEAQRIQMDNAAANQLKQQEIAYFEAFSREVAEARAAVANYRDAVAFMDQWAEIYRGIPDMRGAFRLHDFSCNDQVCHINWVAMSPWADPSVFQGVERIREGAFKVTGEASPVAPNLMAFTEVVDFNAPPLIPVPEGLSHEKMLAQIQQTYYRFEHTLKQLGIVGFSVPKDAVDIVVAPPKEIATKAQPVTIAKGAKISIVSNGAQYRAVRDFLYEMHAPIAIEAIGVSGLGTTSPTLRVAGIIRTPSTIDQSMLASKGALPSPDAENK